MNDVEAEIEAYRKKKHAESSRRWAENNRERCRQSCRNYYQKNAERLRAYARQYRRDHNLLKGDGNK